MKQRTIVYILLSISLITVLSIPFLRNHLFVTLKEPVSGWLISDILLK